MNRKQLVGMVWGITLFSCVGLLFSSCKTPLSESDVPEEEWVVSYVGYNQQSGYILIRIDDKGNIFDNYRYAKDFNLSSWVDWFEMIGFPSNMSVSDLTALGGSIDGFDINKTVISLGTRITFSDAWFYQVEDDALFTSTVRAKIRIATRSIPITIVE